MIECLFKNMDPGNVGETPGRFITQGTCNKAVNKDSWALRFVTDHLKTQKMCEDVVWKDHFSLHFVPDWFVTLQQLKTWGDYHGFCNNDRLIKWYDGYQKRKAQKAKIKEELLLISWHPSHVLLRMRKKEIKKHFFDHLIC